MAQGPSLVAVIPNDEALLSANGTSTLTFPGTFPTAPTEMTFRFAAGNVIDPTTLSGGFIVKSAGNDHLMGTVDDQVITPGYIGVGDDPREVVMRFASTLPDNTYSVTLVGSGSTPLKDSSGNPFNSGFAQGTALTSDASTSLLLHFDQSLIGAAGETPTISSGTSFVSGQILSALGIGTTGDVKYAQTNNIAASAGTVEFWVQPHWSPNNAQHPFFEVGDPTTGYQDGMVLGVDSTNNLTFLQTGDDPTTNTVETNISKSLTSGVSTWTAGQWHHIAVTWDSTAKVMSMYVDGQQVATGAAIKIPALSTGDIAIGGLPDGSLGGDANLDELRISTQALTAQQILTDFNTTSPVPTLGGNVTVNFALDQGATINAVVPQPITRGTGNVLQQSYNTIDVYYDQPMSVSNVTTPGFYQLIDATSGAITLPSSIKYSVDSILKLNLPTGTTTGTTTLSYNGVNATQPLGLSSSTSASVVQSNLSTIAALNGKISVTGSNGGPFTITFNSAPTGGAAAFPNVLPIVSNSTNVTIAQQPKATLTFANPLPAGTWKLNVGTTTEPDDRVTVAQHVGGSMVDALGNAKPIQGYIGDNLTSGFDQKQDVDLYAFNLQNPVSDFSLKVAAAAGSTLNPLVRIFDKNGLPVGNPITASGSPLTASLSNLTLQAGAYYVGVSSAGNAAYNANAAGTGAGGTTTGAYSIQVTFTDSASNPLEGGIITGVSQSAPIIVTSPSHGLHSGDQVKITGVGGTTAANNTDSNPYWTVTVIDQNTFTLNGSNGQASGAYVSGGVWTSDNSSFATSTVLGVLGSGGKTVNGFIGPSFDPSQQYSIQMPGAGDAPGERNIPFEGHLTTIPGTLPDGNSGIQVITYNFQSVYGFTAQGQQFFNSITEPQKQRAREAMELWSRYLGVEFLEVPDSTIADMTIATGDPRAIAPTISTDITNQQNPQGVNGIAGTAVISSNSDITGLLSANTGVITGASNPGFTGIINPSPIVITGVGHGLQTGDYVQVDGVQGQTAANGNWKITVIDQDHFSLDGSTGNGIYISGGTWTQLNIAKNIALANGLVDWGNSQYGGNYFRTIMAEIGHVLGLGSNYEAAALTIMGGPETGSQAPQAANALNAEPVFPGDADIAYGQTVQRPESKDIDLYQFTVSASDTAGGLFRAETIAERLQNSSLLNTVLTLYKQSADGTTRTEVARNDDYYGNDSYLEVHVEPNTTYYLAVTSVGNTEFDPSILDSGFGGRTQGVYQLNMSLQPDAGVTAMMDATGALFDGDANGTPGGTYQFWFQSNTAANTVYVDKTPPANPSGAAGSITNPYTTLSAALNDASLKSQVPGSKKIMRIVGNGGTDSNVSTLGDDSAYLVGFKDPQLLQPLTDGGTFDVPTNVTVMIDAGAAFKLRRANLNAGTTSQGLVSKAGGSIQVLGTPSTPVVFTSYADNTVDASHNAGPGAVTPQGGDYGGIVYREDSDHERDFLNSPGVVSASNPLGLAMPVVLNYVNHAQMTYGGGKVTVDSVESTYDPIYVDTARPTLSYNDIEKSADAAISANPNAFDDDGLFPQISFDNRRIGPDIHDNTVVNDSINGLLVRIRTLAGNPVDFADVPTRWKSTDISYVVAENFEIAGTPGGSMSPGADRDPTTLTDGRLRIDPGVIVKLAGSRIETLISSQFIAEGTSSHPIIFTSLKDDRYGAGGTFDTNNDPVRTGTITGATNAAPILITSVNHGLTTGMQVHITGVLGNLAANGDFVITVADKDHFSLNNTTGNGIYTSGGTWTTLTSSAQPGDWGGLIFGPNSRGSVAQARIFFGGGSVPIEGGFDNFNAVEIQQADVRIANSVLQFNDAGGGTTDRNGRGTNADATIFVRGAQPVIVNNIIRDNAGPVASINANAMNSTLVADWGQATGPLNIVPDVSDNRGPLVRGNRITNNRINGMVIRGGTLTTQTVWDDTDIAHVLQSEIIVPNFQIYGGLRLQSSSTASLVVKSSGPNAGFTAGGTALDINDRIGGTVQVIGQPGFPVVLTSLADDTVSAGFDPNGLPMYDTDDTNGTPLLQPAVNNATLIDNNILTKAVGHFEERPGPAGDLGGFNTQSGVTAQGRSALFTNRNFINQFLSYVDIGNGSGAIDLGNSASSTITLPPTLISTDHVRSQGTFVGSNGNTIQWQVDTSFARGSTTATNVITFTALATQGQTAQPLGTLHFENFFDQRGITANQNNELLYQKGTDGQVIPPPAGSTNPPTIIPPSADFRVETLDDTQRIGFALGGVYDTANGTSTSLVNATFDGWAADAATNLQTNITGGTQTYTVNGNINTANLPAITDPALGKVNGLGNVTTAMRWTVDPTKNTATITTFLQLIPQNPASVGSPGDWRGIKLDDLSNDRNVAEVIESEKGYIGVNADVTTVDHTRTPQQAQFLGSLAPNLNSGDDARRLGYEVQGAIAYDNPADVDVYSFNADSGTEVWIDLSRTSYALDPMVELVDADGNVVARATDTNVDVTDDLHMRTGSVTGATNPASPNPIVITSAAHGLKTGDHVFVSGVLGNTAANGAFSVTVVDADHFRLDGSKGNGAYSSGGTWTFVPTDQGLSGSAISFDKDPYNGRHTYATNMAPTRIGATGVISSSAAADPGVTGAITLAGDIGAGSTTIANLSDTSVLVPGLLVTGTGIPTGATIATIVDAHTITLSAAAIGTNNGQVITFGVSAVPILVNSSNHGLVTGDTVLVSGVEGNTAANGVFTVTVVDPNHFLLNGSTQNGVYTGGGTWTKLTAATRDPIMRVVLPNAANGQPLKNAPFFIRVRSQPATFTGESGNTLNPGQTSGQYQLQVRLQQKTEVPGSTIRFADIRYATDAIEVHGLPYHSPLAGDTAEANDTGNNTRAGAQLIGNLLQMDRSTISVGGTLSSATDVDWYQFDLDFDLLQYVSGYTDGLKTWSTMFDIGYADGLSRPDTTMSVFNSNGQLILIGRDSNVQDDQTTTGSNLSGDSFGKHDAYIGPAQLPAAVPGQRRTYYVAVSSDRMLPSVLDQQFLSNATDSNVRLEPVESIARVADDPLEMFSIARHTSSGTAEFSDSTYINPGNASTNTSNQLDQASSTLIDPTTAQSLQTNIRPFSLGDVQMFVGTQDTMYEVDPTTALAFASAVTDFQTGANGVSNGFASADLAFDSATPTTVTISAKQTGTAGNNIFVGLSRQDLGGLGPQLSLQQFPFGSQTFYVLRITLDTDAANVAAGSGNPTTATALINAIANSTTSPGPGIPAIATLLTATIDPNGDPNADIADTTSPPDFTFIQLSGGSNTPGALSVTFRAQLIGTQGNNIVLNFTRADLGLNKPPAFVISGNSVNITLNTTQHSATSGTTVNDLLIALNNNLSFFNLLTTPNVNQGNANADIANPPGAPAPVTATGDVSTTSRTLTNLSTITGIAVGMTVTGQGIPAGTTVVAVGATNTVDLSTTPNANGSAVKLNFSAGFTLHLSGGNTGFGGIEGSYAPAQLDVTTVTSGLEDIGFRPDGQLFGYESVANNTGTAGRLTLINPGTSQATVVGTDGIADFPTTVPNPITLAYLQTDTLEQGDAMAWGGSVLPAGATTTNTTLYYAVPDPSGASRLYQANPITGSAALATGTPFGRVGAIPVGTQGNGILIGNNGLITAATSSIGSTTFSPPNAPPPATATPVTVSFRTIDVGQLTNGGVIHFVTSHLGFNKTTQQSLPPTVKINSALPADLTVTLNLDTSNATRTTTFANVTPQPSVDIEFDAGPNRLGAAGNNIVINFTYRNHAQLGLTPGPTATFTGNNNDTVNVDMDTGFFPGVPGAQPGSGFTAHTGTTAAQLIQAIANAANNNGILVASTPAGTGPGISDTTVSSSNVIQVTLAGGSDPSTAQDVVNAINNAIQPAGQPNPGQVLQASITAGSGSTIVALEDTSQTPPVPRANFDVAINGGTGQPGLTKGLAFANDRTTLYGVTDEGQFLQNISTGDAVPGAVIPVQVPDPRNPGSTLSGASLRFAALTLGPQDVDNGQFANMFFAMTDDGILVALNNQGQPQPIFDSDGDGVPDTSAILTGISQLTGANIQGFGAGNPVTSLAFSPYDFNLWHPTFSRQNDPGHSMGDPSGLNTDRSETLTDPATGRQQDSQNASMYFGFEPWVGSAHGYVSSDYQPYGNVARSSFPLPTGNDNLQPSGGQFGMIDPPAQVAPNSVPFVSSEERQRELSFNPNLIQGGNPSYNTPVGAYGSLVTNSFSLGSMSASDKPTFYFDYFLDTANQNSIARAGLGAEMQDSARVYIGPFTRFDSTGGPYVTGSVSDPSATATQFIGISPTALSGVDDFYDGKALQFTSGVLKGQTQLITGYKGKTHTFTFKNGFTAAPGNNDSFQIAYGYETWDELATNNSVLDNPTSGGPGTSGVEGELPTFLSTSVTANPVNPRQQVQLLHDNTGQWRQARVDLSRYAGMTGLQLRFDFSTAGEMPDQNGHTIAWEQEENNTFATTPTFNVRGVYPPVNVTAAPGQDYLFEDGFGRINRIDLRQDSTNHEGFYVDNIIIGAAERGEMVINAPANSNFSDLYANSNFQGSVQSNVLATAPQNWNPLQTVPTQVLTGPYQLEARRGTEYGISDGGPLGDPNNNQNINAHNSQTPIILLSTNDRLIPDQRTVAPISDGFESQTFTALPWGSNGDKPWVITTTANSGAFAAASGAIINGQSSGLSIDLTTGAGDLTFARSTSTEAFDPTSNKTGDELRLFIDGRIAMYTAVNGVALAAPVPARWSGLNAFETITVPIAAGHHNFRWSYDKDNTDTDGAGNPLNVGQDRVFIDDIRFPSPQLGVENVYSDPALNNSADPTSAGPPIPPTIPPPNSFALIHFIDTLYSGFTQGGDQQLVRQQGHIQIEQNQIYAAQQIGILIDAGTRDATTDNSPLGSVRNLPTLNNNRLVPGVTVANNVISGTPTGIQYSGDANALDAAGNPVPTAAVPFGRIVNNTIYGAATPTGTGILISNNAGPTLLNNIVANTNVGVSVDPSSRNNTVLGENLFANNNQNSNGGTTTGTNPIFLTATDPLFIDPAHRNFYLAEGSPAIDSSLSTLADRPSIAAVKSSIGIPQSPIVSPTRDLYGQLRLDDPFVTNSSQSGLGQNVFIDRGAVERADFDPPTASIFVTDFNGVSIVDNDTALRDRNRNDFDMAIRNTPVTAFVVQLSDVGAGIDPNSVNSSQFTLTSDGVPLAAGVDYQFAYNAATNQVVFSPSAGIWAQPHTYKITLNNSASGATDSQGNPLQTGILDRASNALASNRADGTTSFTIFVGTLYNFGTAPDPSYPTKLASDGARHVVLDGFHLGASAIETVDAFQNTPDTDEDGVKFSGGGVLAAGFDSQNTPFINTIQVTAAIPAGMTGHLDAWLDFNRDGKWQPNEKLSFDNNSSGLLQNGLNTLTFSFGNNATPHGTSYIRFRLTSAGISTPTGVAPDGEVEDYKVNIGGAPFQNFNNAADVNNDGVVAPQDAVIIINYLNGYGATALQLGQPPIPDPYGGGPGHGLYVDVDGDGILATKDLLKIISVLNGVQTSGGEGESATIAGTTTAASASNAQSTADPIIPPVLYASPSVVIETRDASPMLLPAARPATTDQTAQDAALLALASSDDASTPLDANERPAEDSSDEASWEDLLGSLASDHENKK